MPCCAPGGELVLVRNDYITKERGALGDCYPTPSATTYENLLNRRKFQGGGLNTGQEGWGNQAAETVPQSQWEHTMRLTVTEETE